MHLREADCGGRVLPALTRGGLLPVQDLIQHFREVECGGRVLSALTGSAPTAPEVADFLRDALLIPIIEGYGSTGVRRARPFVRVPSWKGFP